MDAVLPHQESSESTAAISSCCRVCRGSAGRSFTANGFAWFRCETCRTTQKVLTRQQYQDLNPTYDPGDFLDSCGREQVEAFIDVREATKVLSDVINTYLGEAPIGGPRRSFLDIGCGMGRYLIAAERLGFEALGFEPSVNHARVATQHFRLPVVTDYFTADRVNGKKFDLAILSHVIEHIYDPKSFIHELVGVLKPGGALIVITPNNESLVARAIGKAWPMLKPVDHVSMIGASAFDYFDLDDVAAVHHSSSEFPFEFAASALAAVKAFVYSSRRGRSTNLAPPAKSAAPPLRGLGVKAKLLRCGLSAISAPMYATAIATHRQACLKTIVVRKPEIGSEK
jgi:2-polyprenyl-3-methyl-5-hydroxy-6-metoxy-1,4-benzoquinol methylase